MAELLTVAKFQGCVALSAPLISLSPRQDSLTVTAELSAFLSFHQSQQSVPIVLYKLISLILM